MLKKFQKQLLILFAIFSIIILSSINLEGVEWDVYSTMSRADIQAVVDAATDGDTIYFHAGTYNWSGAPLTKRGDNEGAINIIDKSLIIKGELDTLIVGRESVGPTGTDPEGVNAFYVQDWNLDNDVTFDGLNFQTLLRGISVGYITNVIGVDFYIAEPNAKNITVKNCKFSDIHRDAISFSNVRGNVLIQNNEMSVGRMGMFIDWSWSENSEDWQPEDTCIYILDNNVNVNSGVDGVYSSQTTNIIVNNNVIENSMYGIGIVSTRKGAVVSNNSLYNCFHGIHIRGIIREGVEFEAEGAVVEKNKLYGMRDKGIAITGSATYRHTISKNKIHMTPMIEDEEGIGILTVGHDDYFGQNKISGSGRHAFCLYYTGMLVPAHHEVMHANNVDQFTADICHFYFAPGTHNNLVIGSGMEYNTYYDEGTNNRITGVTPMAGGIGQDLSEAIKKRNEELKEARKIKF